MPFDPRDLVAALGSLGSLRGSPAGAAFAQTWQQLEQQQQAREQRETEQRMRQNQMGLQEMQAQASMQNVTADNQRAEREQRMRFVQSLPEFLGDETIETPDAFEQRFGVASRLGSEIGVEPGFLQTFRPTPDKFLQRKAKKVVARIESDKRFTQHLANPDFAAQMFQEGEETKSYAEWKTLAGQGGATADSPPLPSTSRAAVGSFEDYVTRKYGPNPTPEQITEARKVYQQADDRPPAALIINAAGQQDIDELAQQLVDGNLLPSMMSRRAASFNATLAKANRLSLQQTGKSLNLVKLQTDFNAAQRFVASMNSNQMVRFKGLAISVVNTIDEVRTLAEELKQGGIQKWNAAKRGTILQVYGNTPQSETAARYVAAVNTLKEEFANLANGGYAPTEAAWHLANGQINGDYGVKDLSASLSEVQRLINYRLQAFDQIAPMSIGGSIAPPASARPASAPAGTAGPRDGDEQPIPGIRGGIAVYQGGRWIRKQ